MVDDGGPVTGYMDRVLQVARAPLNMGRIDGAHGEGFGGSECGDWVRMWVRLDDRGQIADVKWQAHGCASALASSSVLSGLAKGKALDDALRITPDDVVAVLGGLPEHKSHCSEISHRAFTEALRACRMSRSS